MLPLQLFGQHIQGHQLESNNQSGLGSGEVFSPFKKNQRDSTKVEISVPQEIHQWKVNGKTGEVMPIDADTMQHMFQNWHLTEGVNGEYNFLGNMGTPRQTRIFFNRPQTRRSTSFSRTTTFSHALSALSLPTRNRLIQT